MKKRPTERQIVLSNSYGSPNVGDEAIVTTMIDRLRQRFTKLHIYLLTRDPGLSAFRHPDVEVVQSGILRGFLSTLKAIRSSDLLVVGGGGLLQDSSSLGNLLLHLSRILIARILNTKVVCAGLGVGPIKPGWRRILTSHLLRYVALIGVRDTASAAFLYQLKVPAQKIRKTADFVMAMDFSLAFQEDLICQEFRRLRNQGSKLIGLSVRPFPGKHKNLSKQDPVFYRFLDNLTEAMSRIAKQHEAHIVLISMHPLQDALLFKPIRDRIKQSTPLLSLPSHLSPRQLMTVISLLDILVGMRLHSLVFAARSGVPFVGLSYDTKVEEFCLLMGQEYCLNLDHFSSSTLVKKFEIIWNAREEFRGRILKSSHILQSRSQENIELIASVMEGEL
jgi:polysaccharide pyruvyl transferase CsaB